MKRIRPIALLVLAVLALAGCGSSDSGEEDTAAEPTSPASRSDGGSRPADATGAPPGSAVTMCPSDLAKSGELITSGVGCAVARSIAAGWRDAARCAPPAEASRFSCSVDGYRCLGISAERGVAVSCSRPQRSIAFIAKPR